MWSLFSVDVRLYFKYFTFKVEIDRKKIRSKRFFFFDNHLKLGMPIYTIIYKDSKRKIGFIKCWSLYRVGNQNICFMETYVLLSLLVVIKKNSNWLASNAK